MKIEKKKVFHYIFFTIFLITYLYTLTKYGMGDANSKIRYFTLALATIYSLFIVFFTKKKKYSKEYLLPIITALVFLIMSIIKAKSVGYSLNFRTIVQISLFLLPALYAFGISNILSTKNIIRTMEITLFILIVFYFFESKHNIFEFFKISNWKQISFSSSISFTESNICAEAFLQLFFFFYYFKNIKDDGIDKKNIKICCFISFVFTILSFKRLGMLFAIFVIVLRRIVDLRGKIPKKTHIIMAITFTILTIFYTRFMLGEIFTNIDAYKLTTGRTYIISLWEKKNFFSYGFGSSMLVIGKYLEMDLVQIYLELNWIALILFCYTFFKIANKNLYSMIIMVYVFLNMLTASSLPTSLSWVIMLITISLLSSEKCNDEGINIGIERTRFKKLFQLEE